MKVKASQSIDVNVDPYLFLIELEKEWTVKTIFDQDAYIKDGFWYGEDRYGPNRERKATKEEKEIYQAFDTLKKYTKTKQKP